MAKKKDKVRFGTVVIIILFVSFLIAGFFFLDYQIEQTFTGKAEGVGIQKSNIKFNDATWYLVDFPGCEYADEENRVMQDIGLVYFISYYDRDYTCDYQITHYYSDGQVSTAQSRALGENVYTLKGFNVFDSYKIDICCNDGINRVCQSKKVKNYC